jgi:4'-phosphopantetheinyl transferase
VRLIEGALLDLPPGEAHIWCLDESLVSPELEQRVSQCLSASEMVRSNRFLRGQDRHRFRLTRVLARRVLSRYAAVAPSDWAFGSGPHGKPTVLGPTAALEHNVSKTRGMLVCAVARSGFIGVDVERTDRIDDWLGVACHAFSAAEVAVLRALPVDEARERFYVYWTLKEALGKARGEGLGFRMDWSSFSVDGPITVRFVPQAVERPADWTFFLGQPTPSHRVALAMRHGDQPVSRILMRDLLLEAD